MKPAGPRPREGHMLPRAFSGSPSVRGVDAPWAKVSWPPHPALEGEEAGPPKVTPAGSGLPVPRASESPKARRLGRRRDLAFGRRRRGAGTAYSLASSPQPLGGAGFEPVLPAGPVFAAQGEVRWNACLTAAPRLALQPFAKSGPLSRRRSCVCTPRPAGKVRPFVLGFVSWPLCSPLKMRRRMWTH